MALQKTLHKYCELLAVLAAVATATLLGIGAPALLYGNVVREPLPVESCKDLPPQVAERSWVVVNDGSSSRQVQVDGRSCTDVGQVMSMCRPHQGGPSDLSVECAMPEEQARALVIAGTVLGAFCVAMLLVLHFLSGGWREVVRNLFLTTVQVIAVAMMCTIPAFVFSMSWAVEYTNIYHRDPIFPVERSVISCEAHPDWSSTWTVDGLALNVTTDDQCDLTLVGSPVRLCYSRRDGADALAMCEHDVATVRAWLIASWVLVGMCLLSMVLFAVHDGYEEELEVPVDVL